MRVNWANIDPWLTLSQGIWMPSAERLSERTTNRTGNGAETRTHSLFWIYLDIVSQIFFLTTSKADVSSWVSKYRQLSTLAKITCVSTISRTRTASSSRIHFSSPIYHVTFSYAFSTLFSSVRKHASWPGQGSPSLCLTSRSPEYIWIWILFLCYLSHCCDQNTWKAVMSRRESLFGSRYSLLWREGAGAGPAHISGGGDCWLKSAQRKGDAGVFSLFSFYSICFPSGWCATSISSVNPFWKHPQIYNQRSALSP